MTRTARIASTPQGAESRERILEAAIRLIAERGYSATSVDALCREAGIVKTALYWHFGSKEGLLAAALERVSARWIDEIRAGALEAGRPIDRLDRALGGLRRLVEERAESLRLLLNVLLERAESDPATRETLARIFRMAREALAEGVAASIPVPLADLDLVAHTILSLVEGALVVRLADPEGADLDRLFADLRRTVVLIVADRLRAAVPEAKTA